MQTGGRTLSIDSCQLPKVSQEADPLTTLFIKARCMAFVDVPNLFALPQPNMDELVPVEEVDKYTKQEYTTRLMEASQILTIFLGSWRFSLRTCSWYFFECPQYISTFWTCAFDCIQLHLYLYWLNWLDCCLSSFFLFYLAVVVDRAWYFITLSVRGWAGADMMWGLEEGPGWPKGKGGQKPLTSESHEFLFWEFQQNQI